MAGRLSAYDQLRIQKMRERGEKVAPSSPWYPYLKDLYEVPVVATLAPPPPPPTHAVPPTKPQLTSSSPTSMEREDLRQYLALENELQVSARAKLRAAPGDEVLRKEVARRDETIAHMKQRIAYKPTPEDDATINALRWKEAREKEAKEATDKRTAFLVMPRHKKEKLVEQKWEALVSQLRPESLLPFRSENWDETRAEFEQLFSAVYPGERRVYVGETSPYQKLSEFEDRLQPSHEFSNDTPAELVDIFNPESGKGHAERVKLAEDYFDTHKSIRTLLNVGPALLSRLRSGPPELRTIAQAVLFGFVLDDMRHIIIEEDVFPGLLECMRGTRDDTVLAEDTYGIYQLFPQSFPANKRPYVMLTYSHPLETHALETSPNFLKKVKRVGDGFTTQLYAWHMIDSMYSGIILSNAWSSAVERQARARHLARGEDRRIALRDQIASDAVEREYQRRAHQALLAAPQPPPPSAVDEGPNIDSITDLRVWFKLPFLKKVRFLAKEGLIHDEKFSGDALFFKYNHLDAVVETSVFERKVAERLGVLVPTTAQREVSYVIGARKFFLEKHGNYQLADVCLYSLTPEATKLWNERGEELWNHVAPYINSSAAVALNDVAEEFQELTLPENDTHTSWFIVPGNRLVPVIHFDIAAKDPRLFWRIEAGDGMDSFMYSACSRKAQEVPGAPLDVKAYWQQQFDDGSIDVSFRDHVFAEIRRQAAAQAAEAVNLQPSHAGKKRPAAPNAPPPKQAKKEKEKIDLESMRRAATARAEGLAKKKTVAAVAPAAPPASAVNTEYIDSSDDEAAETTPAPPPVVVNGDYIPSSDDDD